MSNMSSPTISGQLRIDFVPGDIVDANGQICIIIDVLKSAHTGNCCLYVRFVHNIGNARQYDMLEIDERKYKTLGIADWRKATPEALAEAVEKRRLYLAKELAATVGWRS